MHYEGNLSGESKNCVNRLTLRQRRQVASLYGKTPKPMGTWEPLPSLTREETDIILKEFEEQTKVNKASPDLRENHDASTSGQSGLDRDFQHGATKVNNNLSYRHNLSSPSLLQHADDSVMGRARPVTECVQVVSHGPTHCSSPHYHTQSHPRYQSVQSTQQPPSALESNPGSRGNWTVPHLSVYEQDHRTQRHSQTMKVPSPSNTMYTQQHRPPLNSNWTSYTTNKTSSDFLSSQSHPEILHHSATVTQNRALSLAYTTRAPSPVRSSPWTTDDHTPVSANWTRSSQPVDNHSTQFLPLQSTSSSHNYSSQDFRAPSSIAQSVSQLTADMTSLGITLNPSSMENISNVDYSLLVVGITGSGKSSACNFFIGSDVFNTAGGAIAVTAKSDAHVQCILGKQVLFIDTPGFGDEFASDEVRMAELGRAILFAREGVNAIVLCLDGSRRFDSSIAQLLKEFEVLGAFWPYTFIMYTHAADMGNTEQEQKLMISQWLDSPKCPERMKWLFDKVSHRCMTVESKQFKNYSGYYEHKCRELLNMIDAISVQNQHQRYTNQFFQWAKKKYDQVKQQKVEHERRLEETQKNLQNHQSILSLMERELRQKERQYAEYASRQQQYINSLEAQLRSCRGEERMGIQQQKVEAQQQLTYCSQDHWEFVDSCGASKDKMLARYNEACKLCTEHEWQSRRPPLELFLDELRYELYASNRERRELNDKLVCMNAQLQKLEGERTQPHKKEPSTYKTMALDGVKYAAPYVIRSMCSLM